jgi:ATP-dependent protease Clp ATPase subunit
MHVRRTLVCDFCGRAETERRVMVAAPNGAAICDDCIEGAVLAIKERLRERRAAISAAYADLGPMVSQVQMHAIFEESP